MLSTLFSKNIHQQAMEQSLFAAVTINDKNQIIFFNAAAENLFGYTRQEVLGKNVDVLIPTALRAGHDVDILPALKSGDSYGALG